MKTISYYKNYLANGSAMGRRRYWHNAVADDLMQGFGDHTLVPRQPGRDSRDVQVHVINPGHFDIAYLELFDLPKDRPADFVWASIGDFIGLESELERWLDHVRPNLLVTRQYYADPLIDMCEEYGCKLILKPQFIDEQRVYHSDKHWLALMTGMIGPAYRFRRDVANVLTTVKSPDICVSMTGSHKKYPLSDDEYRDRLRHTRFVFSTGIWEIQMPPKHIEICNYGGCLVSPILPWMGLCGFLPNIHYMPLVHTCAIPDIVARDDWGEIAQAGQKMVQKLHTKEAWFEMLETEYNAWKGK